MFIDRIFVFLRICVFDFDVLSERTILLLLVLEEKNSGGSSK